MFYYRKSSRNRHRAEKQTRPGREDCRDQREEGRHHQHPGGERGPAPAGQHQCRHPGQRDGPEHPED